MDWAPGSLAVVPDRSERGFMVPTWLSDQSIGIFHNAMRDYRRVLVLGASGWFGQTAVHLLRGFAGHTFFVASSARLVNSPTSDFWVNTWDYQEIEKFAPELVLDFSFLTRDWESKIGEVGYARVTREFEFRLEWLLSLPSLKALMTISSGAALVSGTGQYGASKLRIEQQLQVNSDKTHAHVALIRVWSVSGGFVTDPLKYALSGFVQSALMTGKIHVDSDGPVFRRYCAVEEILATGLAVLTSRKFALIESGGPKVELLDLAKLTKSFLGSQVQVSAPNRRSIQPTPIEYCSNNASWSQETARIGLRTLSLEKQLENVVIALRERNSDRRSD